ncbi:MAG: ankyrin repeat domain-containing protein [Myxococcota bacterium]
MSIDELIGLIESPERGAGRAELDEAEVRLGFAMGPELRTLLSSVGGGCVPLDLELPLPDGSVAGGFEILSVDQIPDVTAALLRNRSERVVLARDGFGNALVVNTADDVFFWDHDDDQLQKLGASISGLAGLFQKAPTPPPITAAKLWPQAAQLEAMFETSAGSADIRSYFDAISRGDFDAHLFVAVSHSRADVVRDLLERWPESKVPAHAVWLASSLLETETLMVLLENDANPNACHPKTGMPALLTAALAGRAQSVRALLAAGASSDAVSRDGLSLQQAAELAPDRTVAELLAELGIT